MIDDVVREWPDVWRYPDLAAALARGDASTDLAMLLLRGLAEPLTVEQSAHRLIADGEFRAVEELHQKAHLPVRAAKDIADRLERPAQRRPYGFTTTRSAWSAGPPARVSRLTWMCAI